MDRNGEINYTEILLLRIKYMVEIEITIQIDGHHFISTAGINLGLIIRLSEWLIFCCISKRRSDFARHLR